MKKFLLPYAQSIILSSMHEKEVKEFVILLLELYAKSTDNAVDDMVVSLVKSKLFK